MPAPDILYGESDKARIPRPSGKFTMSTHADCQGQLGQKKKRGRCNLPLSLLMYGCGTSAKKKTAILGPVRQYGRIYYLTAAGALPGVECPYEIVEFFSKHTAFAFRTIHSLTPVRNDQSWSE
jgi:hypothetical protein